MPRNGHLNGSHAGGQKGVFGLWKWNFQVFPILGSVRGGRIRNHMARNGRKGGGGVHHFSGAATLQKGGVRNICL